MSTERVTPTSYLVLGLLAREGPSTPYDLERHVAATLGNFWSFPHTLLYSEPARLADLGLVRETREQEGRRRRVFAITPAGHQALEAWLEHPASAPTELRDLGLLQLFFSDLAPAAARLRLAEHQLAIHHAKLSTYERDARLERTGPTSGRGLRTVEHWRGATLPMGLLYERAAVEFWTAVATLSAVSSHRIDIRLGGSADVDAAVSVYLRSNLVRRHGREIPNERVAQVAASLRNPDTWFLIASDGDEPVAMASVMPAREDAGAGPLIPGACYLDLLFVIPERWREGIGGKILDAVVDEAQRRGYSRIQLWTHEDNERAQHLYRSRGFEPTQLTHLNANGALVREWARALAGREGFQSAADRSAASSFRS